MADEKAPEVTKLDEGMIKKGGVNPEPSIPRPAKPPEAQAPKEAKQPGPQFPREQGEGRE